MDDGKNGVWRSMAAASGRAGLVLAPIAVFGLLGWIGWGAAIAAAAWIVLVLLLVPTRQRKDRPGHTDIPEIPATIDVTAADLASASPEPLILCDAHGRILFSNDAALTTLGSVEPGVPVARRFRTPEMQDFLAVFLEQNGLPAPIDYVERHPVERIFRVEAARVGAAGQRRALFFRDHSETRRIDRMRADFIANASHELRTPLASVAGFIETLRGPARDDPEAREAFLQIMQDQTDRMARLIDDLLSLSRLEMRPPSASGEPVDLVALLRSVADSLGPLARELGVDLVLDLPAQPAEVSVHADELVQVFANLIENACKYGHAGDRVEIDLHAEDMSGEIAVTVRDFGPGIPDEHIPRVTERFYRVDPETSRTQKGTGLGLAIVKHVLTRHKGRLTIRSTLGEGSQFIVHLPAARTARNRSV